MINEIYGNYEKSIGESEKGTKPTIWSYLRVSTPSQSLDRQRRNVKAEYPNAVIVEEVFTGTKTLERPKFERLLATIKAGDTLVCDSVSRFSRNKEECSRLYLELYRKGVNLVFLKEPYINSEEYKKALSKQLDMEQLAMEDEATEKLMYGIIKSLNQYFIELATRQIELAFSQSEKEVMDLRQRTREGIATARLNGKIIGRQKGQKVASKKSIRSKRIIRKKFEIFGGELNAAECAKLCNIARSTFYRYVNQILEEESENHTCFDAEKTG